MVIDFHTHCFPEKIAERAVNTLKYSAGGLIPRNDGSISGLLNNMKEDGVDISVVMNIATNPRQQHSVNDFAREQNETEGILAFGSVHPDAEDALCELERIKDMGLKGIKLHPEYQEFYADDEKLIPLYKKASSLGLIVLFHAGCDFGFGTPYHGMPENLVKALKYLDTPVVAAHWGGLTCHEEVLKHLAGLPIYFDTSFSHGIVAKPMIQRIVEKHGTDKLLFGSDSPWHRPCEDKLLIESLDLSDSDKERIYYKNAVELLKI
ncbi:MAG: amidohydrolase family protein [Clostridia bacterium]|nr:amidohydrolase family protein [Clostridia bacterium]